MNLLQLTKKITKMQRKRTLLTVLLFSIKALILPAVSGKQAGVFENETLPLNMDHAIQPAKFIGLQVIGGFIIEPFCLVDEVFELVL